MEFFGRCPCCGDNAGLTHSKILWPSLVEEWNLGIDEEAYIDRQQGSRCNSCAASIRSMALAHAITSFVGVGIPLRHLPLRRPMLRLLELNVAGDLHRFLRWMPRSRLAEYPEVDMTKLPFRDASFDLVVHSDTLEHVPDPAMGLRECRRVLRRGGASIFTVPIIVGRLTRTRHMDNPSYHGHEQDQAYLVHSEYGADVWTKVLEAGFRECRLVSLEFPAGLAIVATH